MGFSLRDLKEAAEKAKEAGYSKPKLPDVLPAGLYVGYVENITTKTYASGNEGFEIELIAKDVSTGDTCGRVWTRIICSESDFWKANLLRFINSVHIPENLGLEEDAEVDSKAIIDLALKTQMLIQTKVDHREGYKDKADIDWFGPMAGYAPLEESEKWYTIIVKGEEWKDDTLPEDGEAVDDFMDLGDDEPEEMEF